MPFTAITFQVLNTHMRYPDQFCISKVGESIYYFGSICESMGQAVQRLTAALINKTDDARISIYFHNLTVRELFGHILNATHTGFAIFPRNQCTML